MHMVISNTKIKETSFKEQYIVLQSMKVYKIYKDNDLELEYMYPYKMQHHHVKDDDDDD